MDINVSAQCAFTVTKQLAAAVMLFAFFAIVIAIADAAVAAAFAEWLDHKHTFRDEFLIYTLVECEMWVSVWSIEH